MAEREAEVNYVAGLLYPLIPKCKNMHALEEYEVWCFDIDCRSARTGLRNGNLGSIGHEYFPPSIHPSCGPAAIAALLHWP